MSIFTAITKETFLNTIWQTKPYVFSQAMPELIDLIDGNELAGLACEAEIESRIIAGYEVFGQWTCQQGPFTEDTFSTLPEKNWTLLVQGMDQWIDEVRDILQVFSFLPQWRLEDIMASYAPIGGGVGPHFDYYDVFLIQVSGSREWRLGQCCDEATSLQDNDQVKLLAEFVTEETHLLQAGDMIYIPAGKAHWGVASSEDCITFSVGFRAPSEKELLSTVFDNMIDGLSEHHRYKDNLASIDEHPAKINNAAHQQLVEFISTLSAEKLQHAAEQAFGEQVTGPRYAPMSELISIEKGEFEAVIAELIEAKEDLSIVTLAHSRLAFSDTQLFVNGEAYNTHESFAESVCNGLIPYTLLTKASVNILKDLLDNGDITLDGD
ncbi:MAG: 50S ribosomal protein L16 3-hydroxylase [Candidatus Endobugula sp.]|jgi:50S ribosomal protein L16 3-hydroxylase